MAEEQIELTDEQHIALSREGEPGHIEIIMDRYKNMVRIKASSMFLVGGEEQDLIQEGMIGLVKAVRDYDFGRDASFSTFADLCVVRQMYNAIQASGRFKNIPLNNYVSLSSGQVSEENSDKVIFVENIAGDSELEPERLVISQENIDEIESLIENTLTDSERDVFRLNMAGMSTSRIAALLSMEPKSADNALQRAKMKLRKALVD